jgi:hypothetical protein
MPGRGSAPNRLFNVLGDGLRRALREVEKKLPALADDPPQEARHGEDNVTMRDRLEHFLLQPLRRQFRMGRRLDTPMTRHKNRPSVRGKEV